MARFRLYYDKQDRDMLLMVNRVLSTPGVAMHQQLFDANLHPHGIKDLVLSQEFRVAYAVINLLTSLEAGQADDRLRALQALHDEVLASAQSILRRNTARVLIQIMKELVRACGNEKAQLRLAHDFRQAAVGTPRIVRKMLEYYHLPEMPEAWNQIAFDDHVHDANTKGRKTPTHLIMDAWVKGIRNLTVVYYNFVDEIAAKEILAAAEIMGISVRIGIEFRTPFRGRFISITWIPRGFADATSFLEFLQSDKVVELMRHGREATEWVSTQVLHLLRRWNTTHRVALEQCWDMEIPAALEREFLDFVGVGQPSRTHLAEFLLKHIQPSMHIRAAVLRKKIHDGDTHAYNALQKLDAWGFESVMDKWLMADSLAQCTADQDTPLPEIMSIPVSVLVSWLTSVHSGYRIVLNLATLDAQDVVELLWDGQGSITHLELFNLKDWHEGRLSHIREISQLQGMLNGGRGPQIKQLVRDMIAHMDAAGETKERIEKFQVILRNIPALWECYMHTPLKTRMGSDSTSRMVRNFGMGLVVPQSLPVRTQKKLLEHPKLHTVLPVHARVEEHVVYTNIEHGPFKQACINLLHMLSLVRHAGQQKERQWIMASDTAKVVDHGNIVTLGGAVFEHSNHLLHTEGAPQCHTGCGAMSYLNTTVANWLKVLVGFIPAMLAFLYTQQWWVMAWCGAFIWFAITGVRNVIEMVVAGQGASRTTLLRWKDHVSIPRLCDSFMYTGISVVLLEVIIRIWLLQDVFGITVENAPLLVFLTLNIVNGFYICAHNLYRGFPQAAAVGNLFRSVLAIPISMLYNYLLLWALVAFSVADPEYYLVPSAAIVSKFASDTVAAIIEGIADSGNNMRMRRWDYATKLVRVFDCYTRLELLFPEEDILLKLAKSGGLGARGNLEVQKVERSLIINALDLMYFWFYLPRAQHTFIRLLRQMPQADRIVLAHSQLVLMREKEISQLFVDGLVGKNFSRPLAFYLAKRKEYLHAMIQLCTPEQKCVSL